MTEMQQALKMLGKLPEHALIDHNGHWFFVGRVRASLAFVQEDGSPPTEEQCQIARQFGAHLAHLKQRSWPSKEEAMAALAAAEGAS